MVLGTSSFFYFFQMLNNWPRILLFAWECVFQSGSSTRQAVIEVYPLSSSLGLQENRLINSADDFKQFFGLVVVSACNLSLPANVTYHWQHYFGKEKLRSIESDHCYTSLHFVKEGQHTVHLTISSSYGVALFVGSRNYEAANIWYAIIGDSFASGEGNPDIPGHDESKAQWLDEGCHRSSKSFAAQVFREVVADRRQKQLTYLACAGATVDNGILRSEKGSSQLSTLEKVATMRGRGPDVVILTTGGNDIGFSDIINAVVHDNSPFDVSLIDMRFFFVSHQLDLVAERLAAIGTRHVFVPQYFDFTKNQYGEVDASCIAPDQQIDSASTAQASLTEGTARNGEMKKSKQESLAMQGNAMGAFHPNEAGHRIVANEILKLMRNVGVLDKT